MILETKRLSLRRMAQGDFPALCNMLQDAEVMTAYEHAFSDLEAQEWLDRQMKRYAENGFGLWAVILKASGEMIGQCGLTMQDCDGQQVLEVGYLFQKAVWHNGYATEAAIACKEYAFETLGAAEVFSIIRDNNFASQAVAKRNGMTLRGQFVKHYYGVEMPHLVFSTRRKREQNAPDPTKPHPNAAIPSICYIKNVLTRPNILVGDYTYYDDPDGGERFEEHVTHHHPFLGDRLIIGKFCAIGKGITFVMNGANHRMGSVTTYPFNIMGGGWEAVTPAAADLPFKGDTVVENDVWIGQNATILPGVHIGNGAIIGANSVVGGDVAAYTIAAGNPAKPIRKRFDDALIALLEAVRWWDLPVWELNELLPLLCDSNLEKVTRALREKLG